jgi:SAM-dependent methyltransferase
MIERHRMESNGKADFADLNEESRRIWNANAEWWDDKIGDGNVFQCELIEPAQEQLLKIQPGELVLDIGCGAGRFTRRMANLGATVVAFDFSERFIGRARERTVQQADRIEYHVADATERDQLLGLGKRRFDAAVATMCLMDMASIDPLMSTLPEMLKPGARFVFSVSHPCFHSTGTGRFSEDVETDGRLSLRTGIKVFEYLTPMARKTEGIVGQPETQYSFHRPLQDLFGTAFRNGFVVDALLEPALEQKPDTPPGLRWRNMRQIPPVLVVRMRLLASPDAQATPCRREAPCQTQKRITTKGPEVRSGR